MNDHETQKFEEPDLASIIAAWEFPPNATYPKGLDPKDFMDLEMVEAMFFAVADNSNILFIGDPGTGKSSAIRDFGAAIGAKVVNIPAATLAPEDLAVPMPTKMVGPDGEERMYLDFLIYDELMDDSPKILNIEEPARARVEVRNQLLELVQERRLADVKIPNVLAVFMSDNEGAESGITLEPDFATRDRTFTVKVDPNRTAWRWALAQKFHDTDLSGVYKVYARMSARLRYLLSPRVLEHVIYCARKGFPLAWGLPIQAGVGRCGLIDENNNDRTDEILDDLAAALSVQNRSRIGEPVERAIKAAVEDGVNVYIEGAPGTAKTAYTRELLSESGLAVKVLSTPVLSPDNFVVPFPSDGKLDLMTMKFFADPGEKALVFDEIWRCSIHTRNKIMEILQERTIGGRPTGVRTIIGLNNPKEVAGFRLDVGRADRAQIERFHISIEIQPEDIPGKAWLLKTYGEDAEPVIEWWEDDLDDAGRAVVTRRGLERLIRLARAGRPLEWAKVYMNGEYMPVPLHDLEARLAKRPLARLRSIVAKVDDYELRLQDPDDAMAQSEVYMAFSKAELEQLESSHDAVVRLMRYLSQQNLINLLRPSGKRQTFWHKVLKEARGGGK